jgi:hypothetical protein
MIAMLPVRGNRRGITKDGVALRYGASVGFENLTEVVRQA